MKFIPEITNLCLFGVLHCAFAEQCILNDQVSLIHEFVHVKNHLSLDSVNSTLANNSSTGDTVADNSNPDDTLANSSSTVNGPITENAQNVTEAANDAVGDITPPNVTEAAKDAVDDGIPLNVTEAAKDLVGDGPLPDIGDIAQNVSEAAEKAVDDATEAAKGTVANGKMDDIAHNVTEAAEGALGNVSKEVKDAVEDIVGDVTETAKKAMEKATHATLSAVELILTAIHRALANIEDEAVTLRNHTMNETSDWVVQMNEHPNLRTFIDHGKRSVRTFYTWLRPVTSALNATRYAIRSVLYMSGFMYLADEVGGSIKEVMKDMNQTFVLLVGAEQVFISFETLAENETNELETHAASSNVKNEINKGLQNLETKIGTIMTMVSNVRETMQQSFEVLVKHLRATVEGSMDTTYGEGNATQSLSDLVPHVVNMTEQVKKSFMLLWEAVNKTNQRFRITLDIESWAFSLPGISPLGFIISACAAWFAMF